MSNNRIVINTSEEVLVTRNSQLPLEIGIVLNSPNGTPLEPVKVNSERELLSYFGTPTLAYPVLDATRSFLRNYYGVTIVKVPTTDGVASEATLLSTDEVPEGLLKIKGKSISASETGWVIKLSAKDDTYTLSVNKPIINSSNLEVIEVLAGLSTTSIQELTDKINNESKYVTATLLEEGTLDISKDYQLTGGVNGMNVTSEEVSNALDVFSSPFISRCDVLLAPGLLTTPELVSKAVEVATDRYETIIIADLMKEGYSPATLAEVLAESGDYSMDESVAYYYPDVYMRLSAGVSLVPASMAALFTHAKASTVSAWTSPAGYDSGFEIPNVTKATTLLTGREAGLLYEGSPANPPINPIIYDNQSGYVVDGQRTGSPTTSISSSIGNAKLINFVTYETNQISKHYQYKANNELTWAGWLLEVSSMLQNIETAGGLDGFEIFMGHDTMTDEDIANGLLRGVVRIRPTSVIEYIEININIVNKL